MAESRSAVQRYHDGTKHHFHRFAPSLGYLDWASQPDPFRRFAQSPAVALYPRPDAAAGTRSIGDLLRHSLGLSAWKQFRESRWSLRVNPSSGNLHPTEAYVLSGPQPDLSAAPALYHYAADRHALELRSEFANGVWQSACAGEDTLVLIALTSIHWREAWKYGERAFRYCQHDLGHALAAVSIAAATLGWRASMLPAWSHEQIAALVGLDRDEDFVDAEREEPGCLIAVTRERVPSRIWQPDEALIRAVRDGSWRGRASQLSEDHVQWTFIDEIAEATRDTGRPMAHAANLTFFTGAGAPPPAPSYDDASPRIRPSAARHGRGRSDPPDPPALPDLPGLPDLRSLVLQRRSAVAFDGASFTDRDTFLEMLSAAMPDDRAPWNALWWTPRLHLAIFVHRVHGLDPGLYLLLRREEALAPLRTAAARDFLWERADERLPLYCLARGDCRGVARRLSCDQDIAADGFFSLGMIAEFDASLDEYGPSFYRHLFWESGAIGQVLYLAAEAAGARATGIGCFYDDPVHDVLGLRDHAFQSLYHFTAGMPVDDARLTTESGYAWEPRG